MGAVQGDCDPRFARVRETFEESFARSEEIGAAVALCLDGRLVVDLWGGHADPARSRPWSHDTLVNLYSTTKGWTALCALRLVDEGRLDLDAPVARVWPEFAAGDKGNVPLRWLLSHRAGLPAVRKPLPGEALYDWDAMVDALAEETPWWPPGERHGYHALTFGWLVGEVVRRVSGRSLGAFFRETVAGPLGLDLHVGLPEREHDRVGDLTTLALLAGEMPEAEEARNLAQAMLSEPEGMVARAFANPPSLAAGPNVPAWRSAEIPAANGHGTARDLARLYGLLARDDGSLLSREALARCRREESRGPDAVLGIPTRFSLGFMLSQDRPDMRFGPNAGAFGHPGAGGSVGFADPEAGLGFGYTMNRMGPRIVLDARPVALMDAVYASLG